MFCISCGTQLPDNARFCSSCGTQVSPQVEEKSIIAQATHAIIDEDIAQLQAQSGMSNIMERVAALQKAARGDSNNPVTRETMEEAERLMRIFEQLAPSNVLASTFKDNLVAYELAQKVEYSLRLRWYEREETNRNAVRKMLEDDWYLYVRNGMDGILKAHTELSESTVNLFTWELKGLAQWLEDECVKNLLLAIRLENVNVTKDSLFAVGVSRLGERRFKAVTDYVAAVMKTVK